MKNNDLYNKSNRATYCPEDDKLRLYVGRVPRPEYDALRAEGWTSTPKQSEAGQGEFSAVWNVEREDTALSYAGEIDDEDTPPTERAADRAERFGGYRDKRTEEATGHADSYDSGPQAHGYQSEKRAQRAAARHDRQADRALTQWDKAEYWTERTAGVIANALHRSSPAVRMGRIKTLEADLRKLEKSWLESVAEEQARFDAMRSVVEHAAGSGEKFAPMEKHDFLWTLSSIRQKDGTPEDATSTPEQIARAVVSSALGSSYGTPEAWEAIAKEAREGTRPALTIAQEWLEGRTRPAEWDPESSRACRHLRMRLAYEMQMLEAQGGRAALVEMVPGGFLGTHQIVKVNKSNATGRVVSVGIMLPTHGRNKWGNESPGEPALRLEIINIERMKQDTYRAPTPEELAAFEAAKKAEKTARPKSIAPALINPTLEDAQRLQALFNAENDSCGWSKLNPAPPSEVRQMTQEQYSKISGGAYASAETSEICALGKRPDPSNRWTSKGEARNKAIGPVVCKVRTASPGNYGARRIIHITDKPAKPLPAAMWTPAETVTPDHATA